MVKLEEQGRSMVEMLGVLAIIGVLSVGGIAGYTTAMRAHKANEIVNATSMCYMMGMSANAGTGGQQLVYSPTPDGVSSITFQTTNKIDIEGIEDATLCAQVKGKLGDKADTCTAATAPATGYKLTVTLGDVLNPDDNPSTAGDYFCQDSKLGYYESYDEGNGSFSGYIYECPYGCSYEYPPEFFSTLSAAKAALCLTTPPTPPACDKDKDPACCDSAGGVYDGTHCWL